MSDSEFTEQVETLIQAILANDETKVAAILKENGRRSSKICSESIRKGMTPLHAATFGANANILRLILKTGVDVNLKLRHTVRQGVYWFHIGSTPLLIAASRRHADIVEILLDKNADPRIENDGEGCVTPLCMAAEKGILHIVKLLVDKGANVNWQDKEGRTPLQRAAQHGHSGIVMLLVTEKGDPNMRDVFGNTALALAAKEGHIKTAVLLIENGAHVDLQNEEGNTPVYHAVVKDHVEIMAMLLIDNGANLDHRNKKGWTVLHYAALFGKMRAVEVLITEGVDLNLQDKSGKTALHHAGRSDLFNIVQLLVEEGADVTIKDSNGKTAEDYSTRKDIKAALAKGEAHKIANTIQEDVRYGYVEEDDLKQVKTSIKELESKINSLQLGEDSAAELCIRLRHLKRELKRFKVKKGQDSNAAPKLLDVVKQVAPEPNNKVTAKKQVKAMFRKCASAIFYSNALSKMVDNLQKDVNAVQSDHPESESCKVKEFISLTQSLAANIQQLQEKAV